MDGHTSLYTAKRSDTLSLRDHRGLGLPHSWAPTDSRVSERRQSLDGALPGTRVAPRALKAQLHLAWVRAGACVLRASMPTFATAAQGLRAVL